QAHWGYVLFTLVNFSMTIIGLLLVDRKGRKFLLILGSAGIIVSLVTTGLLFRRTERVRVDSKDALQAMVAPNQTLSVRFNPDEARQLVNSAGGASQPIEPGRASLIVLYSYGDFTAGTNVARSDDPAALPVKITRESCVPSNRVEA